MKRSKLIILIAKDYIRTLFWRIRPFKSKRVIRGVAVTSLVEQRIDAIFDVTLRDSAIELLRENCGMGLPLMHTAVPGDYDRIRLAVIKLSGGTIEGLERSIGEARIDWRDVLLGAGFGYDLEAHLHWNPSKA
ncbi:MAG: hypothetical protein ABI600_02665 [Luteolibacter sp.]